MMPSESCRHLYAMTPLKPCHWQSHDAMEALLMATWTSMASVYIQTTNSHRILWPRSQDQLNAITVFILVS